MRALQEKNKGIVDAALWSKSTIILHKGVVNRYLYNRDFNWALTFLPIADIMCEAKQKNLASQQLADML